MKKDPEIATSRIVTSTAYNLIFMEPICSLNVFNLFCERGCAKS
jgi:hypothetical protein